MWTAGWMCCREAFASGLHGTHHLLIAASLSVYAANISMLLCS